MTRRRLIGVAVIIAVIAVPLVWYDLIRQVQDPSAEVWRGDPLARIDAAAVVRAPGQLLELSWGETDAEHFSIRLWTANGRVLFEDMTEARHLTVDLSSYAADAEAVYWMVDGWRNNRRTASTGLLEISRRGP